MEKSFMVILFTVSWQISLKFAKKSYHIQFIQKKSPSKIKISILRQQLVYITMHDKKMDLLQDFLARH